MEYLCLKQKRLFDSCILTLKNGVRYFKRGFECAS